MMQRKAVRPIPLDKPYLKGLAKRLALEFIKRIPSFSPTSSSSASWMYRPISTYNKGLFASHENLDLGKVIRKRGHWQRGWVVPSGDPIKIWFYFDKDKTKKGIYKFFHRASWGQYGLDHQWLSLHIDGKLSGGDIEENINSFEKEIYYLLLHEITHAKELFYELADHGEEYKTDPKVYVNTPKEVRAFMQQISDEVLEVGGDFREALKKSKVWNGIRPHLTDKNRKKIIQGVWTAFQDEMINRKKAFRKVVAARPIPVPKKLLRQYALLAYSDMLEVLGSYKPHPRFQDVELKSTPSSKALEKNSRVVRVVEIQPLALEKTDWTRDQVIKVPLKISFVPEERKWTGRQFVEGGYVRSRGTGRMRPYEMMLKVNLSNSYDELTNIKNKPKILQEMFSVLIHEWTHARDWLRANPTGYKTDENVYVNTPKEVRAFMQQISDEVLEKIKNNLYLSFSTALDQSSTWERVREFLTPKNKKVLLTGVWTAVEDAKRSGEIFTPLRVKGRYNPEQLIVMILRLRKEMRLDPDADYYSATDNRTDLENTMLGLAKKGVLWEELRWYGFGFNYLTAEFLKTKLDKDFLQHFQSV